MLLHARGGWGQLRLGGPRRIPVVGCAVGQALRVGQVYGAVNPTIIDWPQTEV